MIDILKFMFDKKRCTKGIFKGKISVRFTAEGMQVAGLTQCFFSKYLKNIKPNLPFLSKTMTIRVLYH